MHLPVLLLRRIVVQRNEVETVTTEVQAEVQGCTSASKTFEHVMCFLCRLLLRADF